MESISSWMVGGVGHRRPARHRNEALAQGGLPNPSAPSRDWRTEGARAFWEVSGHGFPAGGRWGRRPRHVDIDGESIWAFIRCDETSPVPVAAADGSASTVSVPDDEIKNHRHHLKFDAKGNVVKSFGAGMFIWPHGLHVDREGNVWATDAVTAQGVAMAAKAGVKAGHQVIKFSPDGKVLMRLGEAGVPGSDEYHFKSPSAVAVAANGDIFVADGHGADENNRVVKYSKDGKFIKAWGKTGYGPGEFRTPAQASPSIPGAACSWPTARTTGCRIFDQEGKHLSTWLQFGTPSGIAFDEQDQIYVADSESDNGEQSRLGAGDQDRGRPDRLGEVVLHSGSGRQPEYRNGKRAGVRRRR